MADNHQQRPHDKTAYAFHIAQYHAGAPPTFHNKFLKFDDKLRTVTLPKADQSRPAAF